MLGLLLIYFIGKYFYQLAIEFGRNKWGYAVLGVATYYGGMVIFGLCLGVILAATNNFDFIDQNELLLNLIGIPIGVLITWGLYAILKNNWKKSARLEENDILDS